MNKHPQNCGDGVQAIPGGQGVCRRGLHTTDDRGKAEFQGESAGTGAMLGVRKGSGKGVTGVALPNSEQRGEREVRTGGRQGSRGRQAQDLQDGVSRKGWT